MGAVIPTLAALSIVVSMCETQFIWPADMCPEITYCKCMRGIYCGGPNHTLTSFPVFTDDLSYDELHVEGNRITSIPAGALKWLTSTSLSLNAEHNRISTIDALAFSGVETTLTTVNLAHNSLRAVPAALTKLTRLSELTIEYNPITTLSGPLFSSVGGMMYTLSLGSPELQSWPNEIRLLRHLRSLSIYGMKMNSLPRQAFQGFGSSLNNLVIVDTYLHRIPSAICDLPNLSSLNYSNNPKSDSSQLAPTCSSPLWRIRSMYLRNNSLTSFPNILGTFTHVQHLYVTGNPRLQTIDAHQVPVGTPVMNLILNNNSFTDVPIAIQNFNHLINLEMKDNRITSISHAFNVPTLTTLNLSNNPIYYISPKAFSGVPSLNAITLQNATLTTIPEALSTLRSLSILDIRRNHIKCNCSLKWTTHWYTVSSTHNMFSQNSIKGFCDGFMYSRSVLTFVRSELHNCP